MRYLGADATAIVHPPAPALPAATTGTFTAPAATATPACPPGYHWEDTAPTVRGLASPLARGRARRRSMGAIADCVSDTPVADEAQPQLPPAATSAVATATSCPAPWPLWWLVVAAAAGAGVGWYVKNQPKARANPVRMVKNAAKREAGRRLARALR